MEIVNIRNVGNNDTYQTYDNKDTSLISSARVSRPFGLQQDYVEYFIYDVAENLLSTNYFTDSYTLSNIDPVTGLSSTVELDPEGDVRLAGYSRGTVTIRYNFFRKLFRSSVTETFWIKEISTDRTELRVCRQDLSNTDLQQAFNDYSYQVATKAYYPDFYLNLGDNRLLIGVNVLYALQGEEGCLLIKLYEPLPDDIDLKDTFWIVDKLSDEVSYEVTIDVPVEEVVEVNALRGPNYNVELVERINQTTPPYSYATLFQTSVSASYQQLKSIMEEKGLDINVDYSDFSNFTHFSSVTDRITNFAYKASLLEQYQSDIASLQTVSGNGTLVSGSKAVIQAKIDDLIEKFDGYEYYLYYESSSTAWPKSNSTKPYTLYSVTSSQAQNWLGGIDVTPNAVTSSILYSASLYDSDNKDAIINTIPDYLKQDDSNLPYRTFLNMIAQHFDNIWIYLKDVTERYDAENSLTKGISRDLVGDALRALGIKLYTNTSISDNLYYSMLAINPDGSITPPTGSEKIDYYLPYTANGDYVIPQFMGTDNTTPFSAGDAIPGDDITKEYYKRLYHNVPYLLKTRGTQRGLRALINCFGIPDTILRINEYGGSDKSATTPDLVQRRHSLAYYNTGSSNIQLPWNGQYYYYLSSSVNNVFPDTIEFRFKSTGIPSNTNISQSIFQVGNGTNLQFGLNLVYDSGSAIPSSSYQYYGSMHFFLMSGSGATTYAKTAPIYLPFYDPNLWWNIMIQRETGSGQAQSNSTSNRYWVYAKSTGYNEEGNADITYQASQSLYVDGATSSSYNNNWNRVISATALFANLGGNTNNSILCPDTTRFQGYFQEFRYWKVPLSEEAFDEHVINSTSYRGNDSTASLFDLTFRLPLGSNLNLPYQDSTGKVVNAKDYDLYELGISTVSSSAYIYSNHPAITGSFKLPFSNAITSSIPSFRRSAGTLVSYGTFGGTNNPRYFQPFEIVDLIPTPATGTSQKVNNKVTIAEDTDLAENVLSPFVSLQRYNQDISKNSIALEVGFSPSDALDLDITNQLGYFNVDDYIGAPSDAYTNNYADLEALRATYFQKYIGQGTTPYTSQYNVKDFIRLIKYYDNSLFKMIKDFVPARANVATGVIVKPNILNRPKYARNEPIVTNDSTYTSSINMVTITGSNPEDTYLNTAYTDYLTTPLGTVTQSRVDLREAFTGEFKGSNVEVTDGIFTQVETSAITAPWTSSIAGGLRMFTTYSIDPLQNNVNISRKSQRFLYEDFSSDMDTPVNNGFITQALALYRTRNSSPGSTVLAGYDWLFADVNDYNWQTYTRRNIRYEGSKVTSQYYNVWTSPDTYLPSGSAVNTSYGKTAAVDRNSFKVGWVKNIPSDSLNFLDKTQIQLKYLVDKDLNVTDLSLKNDNLFEVQNIFKSGDPVVLSLSDATKPSFQKTLDGTKTIFKGGYSYDPIVFREGTEVLRFLYRGGGITTSKPAGYKAVDLNFHTYANIRSYLALLQNRARPIFTPLSTLDTTDPGYIYSKNYGGVESPPSMTPGAGQVSPDAMAVQGIQRSQFNTYFPGFTSESVTFDTAPYYALINPACQNNNWNQTPSTDLVYVFDLIKPSNINNQYGGYVNDPTAPPDSIGILTEEGQYLFKAPRQSTYRITGQIPIFLSANYNYWLGSIGCEPLTYNTNGGTHPFNTRGFTLKVVAVIQKCLANADPFTDSNWTYVGSTKLPSANSGQVIRPPDAYSGQIRFDRKTNNINWPGGMGSGTVTETNKKVANDPLMATIGLTCTFEADKPDRTIYSDNNIYTELSAGDLLRVRMLLYDHDKFLSYGKNFRFEIGRPNSITAENQFSTTATYISADQVRVTFPNTNIEVVDVINEVINYTREVTIVDSNLVTPYEGNSFYFTPQMTDLLLTASIFIPSGSTEQYYSPVLDTFSIQKYDLIRIGSIQSSTPAYYTVTDTGYTTIVERDTPQALRASLVRAYVADTVIYDFTTGQPLNAAPVSTIAIIDSQEYGPEKAFLDLLRTTGQEFSITAPGIDPTQGFKIRDVLRQTVTWTLAPAQNQSAGEDILISTATGYIWHYIISDSGNPNIPSNYNTIVVPSYDPQTVGTGGPDLLINGTTTFTPQTTYPNVYKVTVDRNIDAIANLSQNFAVLRPKPDETSVIVNFKKSPGDVSQTILIPQDASDDLKNNVGNIFQNLNTDLTNTQA